jgi:hypothetical protein
VRVQSEVHPCAADVRHAEGEEYAEFRGIARSEVEDVCEDFRWKEVDRVRAIVRVGADGPHPVVARQGSGRGVG